ncbi:MAG: hypothetical protein HYU36_19765 [Planctomycetes bacterium]|nr:hypothetical protein [Planctomycetota bacterium]
MRIFCALSLALLGVVTPPLAVASSLIYYSLEKLAKDSEVILVGRCTGCQASWNEGRTLITTEITFQVSRYVKGFLGPQVTIRQLGGRVGNDAMSVSGMPEFQPSGEVVLFLGRDQSGGYQVVGMTQGRYQVLSDPDTGEKLVRAPEIAEEELVHTGKTRSASESAAVPGGHLTLDGFCARIQKYLEQEKP